MVRTYTLFGKTCTITQAADKLTTGECNYTYIESLLRVKLNPVTRKSEVQYDESYAITTLEVSCDKTSATVYAIGKQYAYWKDGTLGATYTCYDTCELQFESNMYSLDEKQTDVSCHGLPLTIIHAADEEMYMSTSYHDLKYVNGNTTPGCGTYERTLSCTKEDVYVWSSNGSYRRSSYNYPRTTISVTTDNSTTSVSGTWNGLAYTFTKAGNEGCYCTYTILSVTPHQLIGCHPQTAYVTVKYNVSGYENATNQTKKFSYNTARCERSTCTYSVGIVFRHGNCPINQFVDWVTTKSGCENYTCSSCISIKEVVGQYTEFYNNCYEDVLYSWTHSGGKYYAVIRAHSSYSIPTNSSIAGCSWNNP